jgi:hypothetical protein
MLLKNLRIRDAQDERLITGCQMLLVCVSPETGILRLDRYK